MVGRDFYPLTDEEARIVRKTCVEGASWRWERVGSKMVAIHPVDEDWRLKPEQIKFGDMCANGFEPPRMADFLERSESKDLTEAMIKYHLRLLMERCATKGIRGSSQQERCRRARTLGWLIDLHRLRRC